MLRIGVLASHQGTNFQAIAQACNSGQLNAKVQLLICNNSRAKVFERAANLGIHAIRQSSATHSDPAALDQAMATALRDHEIDLVVLAGYMKKLGDVVLSSYEGRIINVHPSLLPRFGGAGFYGQSVHEAVLKAGDIETGATVHLVDAQYDTGRILLQERITVAGDDTADSLAARLHPIEHQLLIRAIDQFCKAKTGIDP